MRATALKKSWFFLTFLSNLSLTWVMLKFINNLPNFIISPERKKGISNLVACILARLVFYLNPQININSSENWDILKDNQPFVMLINHTSQLDGFFFFARTPLKFASKIRTLFKAELLQAPFLGDLLRYGGHFPVHYKESEVGKFSVDKEKQAKVLEDIKQHLSNGGHLAYFPEGQINRGNTLKLQTFRQGTFKLLAELDMNDQAPAPAPTPNKSLNMYAFLHTGLEKSWHPEAKLGGASAEVHCRIFPLLFSKELQANVIRDEMQNGLDDFSATLPAMLSTKKSKL